MSDSSLKQSSPVARKLTKAELEELSWKFLNDIAEKVGNMPKGLQQEITRAGKKMMDNGMTYIHEVNKKALMAKQADFSINKSASSRESVPRAQ